MIPEFFYALLGPRKSRYLVSTGLFFALLTTYVETGLQQFVETHINRYLAIAVISIALTSLTAGCMKLVSVLLTRFRSGWWLYGLTLEPPVNHPDREPNFVVGYFQLIYEAENDRYQVKTAACFDCNNVQVMGKPLIERSKPRATWIAERVWITEEHMDLVYRFQKLGPVGERAKGGAPQSYLGLMLLETDREDTIAVRYDGEVRYVQDTHEHDGVVYCEKCIGIRGSIKECIIKIETALVEGKARHLVDRVATIRNQKKLQ